MPTINQLSAVDSLSLADAIPVFSSNNGDARKASLNLLLELLQDNLLTVEEKVTQYSAPNTTGFNVQVNDDDESVWLVLTPQAGYAAGTITLPAVAKCADKQELLVNCTQVVTALTVAGNGATVSGAPTALAANAFFRLRFEAVAKTWYRIG